MLADVKKQLLWQGLARWRRACWPRRQKLADVQSLLHEAGVAENVICFEAHSPLALSRAALRSRVEECWHLTEQNEMYEAFIALFRPLPLLRDCDPSELTPDRCFRSNCSLSISIAGWCSKTRCCRKSSCRRIGQGKPPASCVSIFINA